jgi:hypothetical protein
MSILITREIFLYNFVDILLLLLLLLLLLVLMQFLNT